MTIETIFPLSPVQFSQYTELKENLDKAALEHSGAVIKLGQFMDWLKEINAPKEQINYGFKRVMKLEIHNGYGIVHSYIVHTGV